MSNQNVSIVGTLGRDPELRYTAGGQALTKFSVAVSKRYQRKGAAKDEWEEDTTWFNVVCWGPLAENVSASLLKGHRVLVTGEIKTNSWEDRETGQKRYGWDINADHVGPSLRWATARVDTVERDRPMVGPEEDF